MTMESAGFVPSLKQASGVTLRIRRELPIPGEILVKEGQTVAPKDIVARAELAGEVLILRVAENLGIEPEAFIKGLKVKAGDKLSADDLICQHRGLFGLFNSKFSAPQQGTVDFISQSLGHIGFRLPSTLLEVNSYTGGKVVAIETNRAVEIETAATIIQGIFGVGGEKQGILNNLDVDPSKALSLSDLPAQLEGRIIVGGTLPDAAVLKALGEAKAAGLVVGGIDDVALADFLGFDLGLAITGNEKVPFPLIVTEGFGRLSISARVRDLLRPLQDQFACLNGTTQIRAGAIRPELIVPGAEQSGSAYRQIPFNKGSRVRLIRVPYFGMQGEIVDLPVQKQLLQNGVSAKVAAVKLDSGGVVTAPVANMEVLN